MTGRTVEDGRQGESEQRDRCDRTGEDGVVTGRRERVGLARRTGRDGPIEDEDDTRVEFDRN